MKKILLAGCLLGLLCVPSAQAADRCYAPEHVRAERLLRLHSELMVITVTCRQSSTGRDLPGAYAGFTRNNISALHEAEESLSGYYRAAYGGKGVDRLDKLRTQLANEYGQQIADLSAPVFCGQRRDKVISYFDSPPHSLAEDAERQYAYDRTYAPLCGSGTKVAQNTAETPKKQAAKPKKTKKKENI